MVYTKQGYKLLRGFSLANEKNPVKVFLLFCAQEEIEAKKKTQKFPLRKFKSEKKKLRKQFPDN